MNFFRQSTAYFLLFFMTFCLVKNTALLSLYEFNQDLFVSLLCENKARPSLKCNGHCQLSKISKEQQQNRATQVLNDLQTDIFFFHEKLTANSHKEVVEILKNEFPLNRKNLYSFLFFKENSKPPTFLV